MKHSALFTAITIIFFAISYCSKHKAHWSYDGGEGPAHWGDLDSKYLACKTGSIQSPVNITEDSVEIEDLTKNHPDSLASPVFHYKKLHFSEIDNGHTIQANVEEGDSLTLEGKNYVLKQVHFHSPSENHLNGRSYPLEGHLVHQADDGELAVVAVFYNASPGAEKNSELEKIWNHIPAEKEKEIPVENEFIDFTAFFPENKTMYRFDGSLTTPPCSEGVKWNVFASSVLLPESQIIAFQKHYDHNARPVQELNHRKIVKTASK